MDIVGYKNTLGVGKYVLITGINYTVNMRTVFQEMVLISSVKFLGILEYKKVPKFGNFLANLVEIRSEKGLFWLYHTGTTRLSSVKSREK